MQHGFIGDQVTTINIQITNDQQITYTVMTSIKKIKEIIFSLFLFTKLSGDVFKLNLRGYDEISNLKIKSLELDCLKLFELENDPENYAGLFFLPMIKERNFIYHATIELYIIQRLMERLKYVCSILCGVTKLPMKESLYSNFIMKFKFNLKNVKKIDLLISSTNQRWRCYFIGLSNFNEKIQIQIYPTYQLQKIQKIKATNNLYVYGSEIDVPACIYLYSIYANQMDILDHVIRPNISSLKIFNVISIWEYNLILISFNELREFLQIRINFQILLCQIQKQNPSWMMMNLLILN
ncbi:unnamed protein product [Paramecium octaurelia]|uniref:Uncharacterized protein n=1 Tax=Paramecium octaurelia TaxID=43137 RepID=A0A8S1UCI1_PAROT|nr:unnamed protein product [Paramecium octaurelia]